MGDRDGRDRRSGFVAAFVGQCDQLTLGDSDDVLPDDHVDALRRSSFDRAAFFW